jgi:hypothetical protein
LGHVGDLTIKRACPIDEQPLDHLVGTGEQRRRNFEAEQPRSDKRSEDEVKPVGGPWPDPEAREQMSQADARRDAGKHSSRVIRSPPRRAILSRITWRATRSGSRGTTKEEHIDFSESQLDLVAKVGLESLCLAPHRKA